MAKRKRKRGKSNIVVLIFTFLFILYGIYADEINQTLGLDSTSTLFQEVSTNLEVYYLDVGQADSIFIQNNGESMLIDAGNNEDGELLVRYFQDLNVKDFKYVVGTHPHEDHIGGLDDIIKNFEIGTIYMPDAITTTATFVDVLDAMEEKNMTYTVPKIGETFSLGEAQIKVIYTGTDTSDLNNTSIVLKLTFGNTSFLFTGDATSDTEKNIMDQDIQVDVLKVGHHGSKYSSTEAFLDTVSPKYAIISVGSGNSYGHPADSTLMKLQTRNIEIYRTDELGTILVTSDGNAIEVTNFETATNGG